jgi:hypothetical protein
MRWWRRKQREEDLDRELRSDLELETAEQQESGLPPDEAKYAAKRALGNVGIIQEDVREMWGWSALDHFCQDIRLSLRGMRRGPGFTIVAILTLALGIGSTTLVFSVIEQTVVSPDPYVDQHRLVAIDIRDLARNVSRMSFPPPEFLDYEEQSGVFDGVWGFTGDNVLYRSEAGTERLLGLL